MIDWRTAPIDEQERAMLEFAMKLTREPESMRRDDVDRLRDAGFEDRAIHDIVQVTALFAYYNRIADGLGIDDEPDWKERGIRP